MATLPSTVSEFNKDLSKFIGLTGDKSNSQGAISGAHKAVALRYLGLQNVTDDEIEICALHLQVATSGALDRGWDL